MLRCEHEQYRGRVEGERAGPMPERQESYNTQEHYSIDELAKGLTSVTIPRGGALKLLGSVLRAASSMGLFSGVASAGSVGGATAGIRVTKPPWSPERSEEHTSELQSRQYLV